MVDWRTTLKDALKGNLDFCGILRNNRYNSKRWEFPGLFNCRKLRLQNGLRENLKKLVVIDGFWRCVLCIKVHKFWG